MPTHSYVSFTMSFSDDSSYNGDSDNSYVDSDVEEEAQLPRQQQPRRERVHEAT
jgi:hypothetical protein